MIGKIANQLKEENKVSDFWFLVLLLGLPPCTFTALTMALFIAKPKLRQIKFIDYLIEKLDFDQHDSVFPGMDFTYIAAFGSTTVKLSTACKAGVSTLILAFAAAEKTIEMLKWELTTWNGSVRFLPPLLNGHVMILGLLMIKLPLTRTGSI